MRVNAHAWKSGMVFALGMLLRANHGLFIIYTVYIYGTIFHIVFREGRHSTKQIAVLIGKNSGVDVIAQVGFQMEIEMGVLVWLGVGCGDIGCGARHQSRGIL